MGKNISGIKRRIKKFYLQNLNIYLFVSIVGMFFLSPLLEKITGYGYGYSRNIFFTIIFISSALAVKVKTKRSIIFAFLISSSIWLELLFFKDVNHFDISFFIMVIYFTYILTLLIIQLVKTEIVNSETIIESINIYLLIGFVGAIILSLINHFIPGSLNIIESDIFNFHEYLYFSFVTLTTLGYGDISPTLPLAKSTVIFLAIIGQFYIAVVMAVLISKFFSQKPTS